MTWGKISDDLHSHPKWLGAPPEAKALWTTSLSFCSHYLTDGFVSEADHLPTIAVQTFGLVPSARKRSMRAAAALVDQELWKPAKGGWRFNDWKDYNPSGAQVRKRRTQQSRRQWLHRTADGRALKKAIRVRDGDRCSWCSVEVRWGASRSPDGGTYDHLDPDGPTSLENLVVACNLCNGKKRDLDPVDSGLALRSDHALFSRRLGP